MDSSQSETARSTTDALPRGTIVCDTEPRQIRQFRR